MSQLTNDALLEILPSNGEMLGDEINIPAGAGTTQATATKGLKASVHRVTQNAVSGAAILMQQLLTNTAPSMVWVINDSALPVSVFCAPGENMNGVANSSLSVTAGNAAVFIAIPVQVKRKGGTTGGGTLNWSASLIS